MAAAGQLTRQKVLSAFFMFMFFTCFTKYSVAYSRENPDKHCNSKPDLQHISGSCSADKNEVCIKTCEFTASEHNIDDNQTEDFRKFSYTMAGNKERTFIMIKPDGVQRGLVGKIIQRFEEKGFKLVAMKFMWASKELLEQHYADLSARPFFPGLVNYMASGPVVPMVWEGLNVVKTGRVMLGETNPADSKPGTIRGDYCIQVGRNIIHGSDAVDSANKEIGLWFKDSELAAYTPAAESWVYE